MEVDAARTYDQNESAGWRGDDSFTMVDKLACMAVDICLLQLNQDLAPYDFNGRI